jgi:type VI secretion system secreted protein VgrG
VKKKTGKACTYVKPAAPSEAVEADEADPGKVAEAKAKQKETGQGKYGSQKAEPFEASPESGEEEEKSWIEIELFDEEDEPVAGERYEIKLPDGSVSRGSLDGNGFARVAGFDPGQCEVTFPELDREAWEPKS